jgi:hypothetical protein
MIKSIKHLIQIVKDVTSSLPKIWFSYDKAEAVLEMGISHKLEDPKCKSNALITETENSSTYSDTKQ